MLVYHGTSANHLSDILKNGLRPRGQGNGQWEKYPSRSDCVYLTTSYPFFFAMATPADQTLRLVVEIDTDKLDQSLLLPDEDFIAQGIVHSKQAATLGNIEIDTVHDEVRDNLEYYIAQDFGNNTFGVAKVDDPGTWDGPPAWEVSVKYLTTCCHRGTIPPTAFNRYCLFDYSKRPFLSSVAYNQGTHIGGPHDHYRNLTAWFFGDRKKLPRFRPEKFAESLDQDDELKEYLINPNWKREEQWRGGIEVKWL